MFRKLIKNSQGFTLVELMIVTALIGILASIAIPNFITYRNKASCSAAESDAQAASSAIANYYANSGNTNLVTYADLGLTPSLGNTVVVGGTIDSITISVTDGTGRCPTDYQISQAPDWDGNGVFALNM